MKCRVRVAISLIAAAPIFAIGANPQNGKISITAPLSAQDAAPLGERGDLMFRPRNQPLLPSDQFIQSSEDPGDASTELFDGNQLNPDSPLDTLNEQSLFSDNRLDPAEDNFDRFEPVGGEPEEQLLTGEREIDLQRESAESGVDFQTPDDRRAADAASRADGQQTGDEAERDFEEEFLAAERALEAEDQGLADEREPEDTALAEAIDDTARDETEEGDGGEARTPRRLAGANDQAEADVNDITGSLRPNAMEDPYDPLGKRLGSFLLFSELTISGLYSDNPTASNTNGPGDSAIEYQPRFLLRSDWSRHSLAFEGQLTKSHYNELTSENEEEWFLNATGRVDLRRNEFFQLTGRLENAQDDRGDVDAANTDSELATFRIMSLTGLYHVEFNRVTVEFIGNLTDYDYEDIQNSLGATINNDDLDYLESNAAVRLGYSFHPGFYVFMDGRYVTREYDQSLDDLGFARSNKGWSIESGMILDLTSKLRLEASLGLAWLHPDDNRFVDIEEIVYSAALTYRLSEKTTLRARASRVLDDTDINGTVGNIESDYSLALDHYFRPHILFNARFSYRVEEYPGIALEEDTLSTSLSLQYIFNRHARLISSYSYRDVEQNTGSDYQVNSFRLGVILRP